MDIQNNFAHFISIRSFAACERATFPMSHTGRRHVITAAFTLPADMLWLGLAWFVARTFCEVHHQAMALSLLFLFGRASVNC